MKDSDSKLADVRKYDELLFQYVVDKKIKLQDAYNYTRSKIEMVSEYKGRGTRSKNLPSLDKAIESLMKSHRPKIEELLESIKKQFVFTWDKSIKDYIEK